MTDHERDTLTAADEYRDARIECARVNVQVQLLNNAVIALRDQQDAAWKRLETAEAELHRVAQGSVTPTEANGALLVVVPNEKVA